MMITAHLHGAHGGFCPFSTRKPPRFGGVFFPAQQLKCELLRAIYSACMCVCVCGGVCVKMARCSVFYQTGIPSEHATESESGEAAGMEPWLENMPTLPSSEWKPPSDSTAPNGGEINQQTLQLLLRLHVDTPTSPIVHRCLPLALLN